MCKLTELFCDSEPLCSPVGGKMMKSWGETPHSGTKFGGLFSGFLFLTMQLQMHPESTHIPSPLTSPGEATFVDYCCSFCPPHLSPGHPVLPKALTEATGDHQSSALSHSGFWAPRGET